MGGINSRADRVLIGAFVDPRLKRAVALLAESNGRSVSAELRTALRRHVCDERRVLDRLASPTHTD